MKLKNFNEAVWFDYPDAQGVRIRVRPVPQFTLMELRNKIHENFAHEIDGRIEVSDYVDKGRLIWEIFDYGVIDWEGIEIEGVKEKVGQKKSIYNFQPLCVFALEKIFEVTAAIANKVEQELKNSNSSQDG
jgi:hypothetical protein